jgi:hypothetical protein
MSGRVSRAERFEDEKRRIIESCFSKRDEDGSCEQPFSIGSLPSILALTAHRSNGNVHNTH